MNNKFVKWLLMQLIELLMSALSPEMLKDGLEKLLTWAEETAKKSTNTLDDAVVLPLCALIRSTFGMPNPSS